MTNPTASISNQLNIDVDIYDVYNASGDPKGQLTYTKLGSVAAGQTQDIQTIHFASQLQAMFTGTNENLHNNYYYQFPMAVFGISLLSQKTAYTITADDRAGMEQAFNFIKYTTANASSTLAKTFMATLADKDQEKAVDAFFARTGSFQQCTLSKWTAVVAWQTQFTSPWQGPYYLYTQEQDASGHSTVRLVAVMQVSSDATHNQAILSIAQADGTLAANPQTTELTMAGDGSFSEMQVGTGDLAVSLMPVWINVIQTDTTTTKYLIGPALSGTINGIQVLGTQQRRTLPDDKNPGQTEAEKEKERLDSEREFDRIFSKITTLASLLVGVATLFVFIKQLQAGHAQKRNEVENKAVDKDPGTKKDDITEEEDQVESEYESEIEEEVPLQLNRRQRALEDLPRLNQDVAETIQQSRLENTVDRQVDNLQEVLETQPPSDKIEQTAADLYTVQQDIQDGKIDGVEHKVQQIGEDLKQELQQGNDSLQSYEKTTLSEVQQDIAETARQNEALENARNEQQREEEQAPEEDISEGRFEEPESDPLPVEVGGK